MAPTTRARATNEELVPTALHAAYYAQRATAGMIITEGTWVSERAIGSINVPGIFTEAQVDAWRQVTDVVHAVGGRIVIQLWHTGATSHPDHLNGARPTGPSEINPHEQSFTPGGRKTTVTPREMTIADIERTIADFGVAAEHARRAGFDGVEIAANGTSLLPQFFSPRLNRRTDPFGQRRELLLLRIVDAVTSGWGGPNVGVRLSPYWTVTDRAPAGEAPGEYPYSPTAPTLVAYDRLVAELNERPLAFLHLRGPAPSAPGSAPDLDAFARYRRLFEGALIANNGFDRASGNAIVAARIADAVSFAALFIANPDLASRFALQHELATADRTTSTRAAKPGSSTTRCGRDDDRAAARDDLCGDDPGSPGPNGRSTEFADQYMRIAPQFEVGSGRYSWVRERLFLGRGRLTGPGAITYELYRVV